MQESFACSFFFFLVTVFDLKPWLERRRILLLQQSQMTIDPVLGSTARPRGSWKRAAVPDPSASPFWEDPARVRTTAATSAFATTTEATTKTAAAESKSDVKEGMTSGRRTRREPCDRKQNKKVPGAPPLLLHRSLFSFVLTALPPLKQSLRVLCFSILLLLLLLDSCSCVFACFLCFHFLYLFMSGRLLHFLYFL